MITYRQFHIRCICFLILFSIHYPQFSFAQADVGRMFKKYTTQDGMLNNGVYAMDRSKNGLWWIGTSEGLQRFDGYRFEKWIEGVDKSNVIHMGVQKIFEDSQSNVWVFNLGFPYVFPAGSKKYQLVKIDSTKETYYPDTYLLPLMEKDGRIWCFQDNTGFYGINMQTKKIDTLVRTLFKPGQVTGNVNSLPFMGTDENGLSWITQDFADSNYIMQFKPGSDVKRVAFPVNKYGRLKAYIPVGDNWFLYLSTTYTALCKGDDFSHPIKILSTENIPGNFVRYFCYEKLKVYNKGSFIFAGEKGIYEYIPSTQTLQEYATAAYPKINLTRQFIFVLKEDERGNIWIGRDASDGLLVFYPGKLKFNFLQAPAEYFNLVYSLASDKKGKVIATNFQKGINVFDKNGKWERYIDLPKTENGLSPSMRSMNFIDSNHLVMKSLFGKMAVLNTNDYSLRDISSLLPLRVSGQNTFDGCFLPAGENTLHFVHDNYVLQLKKQGENYKVELLDSLFSERSINTFTYLSNGQMMLGTSDGCYIKNKNQWEKIPGTDRFYFKHIVQDSEGAVWAASTFGILLLKENKVVKIYNVTSGLLNEFVYGILFDDDGNAWYSCNMGLGCIQKNGNIKFFTEADGLQGDEFDTQSFWKGVNGKLYFGGIKGISSFYPRQVLQAEKPGKIILSRVEVNGIDYPAEGRIDDITKIELAYNQNAITFNFTLNDFSDPGYNLYQVKLSGFDADWVNLKNLHSTRYSLHPGSYKLYIKGSNDGSNWSEEFVLPIIINPAWWQTGWFKWLIALLGICLLVVVVWNYNRKKLFKLNQQLQLQQEMQKERERISRDLHDNIGAYSTAMIANTDSLEQMIVDGESKKKVLYLKENARNILSTIRETIWLLNSKNLTVSGFAEGFINYCSNILRNYEGIEIEFKEDIVQNKNLSPAVAINLLRILQEVIQNIVKHSHADKIYCSVSSDKSLSINIRDNGKGFDTTARSHGNGLENMKHRAAEINFDLIIKTGLGKGTEITLNEKV